MSNEILTEIACPNCLNPIDVRQHGHHVTCDACQSQFILEGRICPTCNAYHRQEQAFCSECGQALTRVCQKCHTVNWAGDEYCQQCGAAMDIFQLLQKSYAQTTADRLQAQMESSKEIKEAERQASEKRMAKMMAEEAARQQELARRRAIQRRKDRLLFQLLGLVVLLVIMVILVVAFF